MENMRNKIKQILTMCFVIAAMAVVWNAPVWAGTATGGINRHTGRH